MLVNKKALALKAALGKSREEGGYDLDHIKLTENRAIATDGALLIELANPPQERIKDFPYTVKDENARPTDDAYLDKTMINRIEKNLPKNPVQPILENFLVLKDRDNYKVVITDMDSNIEISQYKTEMNYPDIPEWLYEARDKEDTNAVYLSVDELEKLIKVIKKINYEELRIKFYVQRDPNKPVVFEFEEPSIDVSLRGVLMPMKEPYNE